MCAWGSNGGLASCESLVIRVEKNDPTLVDLVLLPMKQLKASDVDRIAEALHGSGCNTHLRSIQASGHAVPADTLNNLGRCISKGESGLRQLAIGDKAMGDEGCRALLSGLLHDSGTASTLESIDLSFKGLGFESWLELTRLARSSQRLTSLTLARNIDLLNVPAPRAMQLETQSLEYIANLDLSGCNVDSSQCKSLCHHLRMSKHLSTLRLSSNPIGCCALSSAFEIPTLQELYAENCNLGNEEFSFPEAPSQLRVLDLSENGLGRNTIESLAAALRGSSLPVLAALNLSQNEGIGCEIEALVGALKERHDNGLPCLENLDLSQTACTLAGAQKAFKDSYSTNLRLFGNSLGSEGLKALSLHGGHPFLHSLDLGGNKANEDSVVGLLSGLLQKDAEFDSVLETLIIGGNQGGSDLEEICQKIKECCPKLDIARDKVRKSQC